MIGTPNWLERNAYRYPGLILSLFGSTRMMSSEPQIRDMSLRTYIVRPIVPDREISVVSGRICIIFNLVDSASFFLNSGKSVKSARNIEPLVKKGTPCSDDST